MDAFPRDLAALINQANKPAPVLVTTAPRQGVSLPALMQGAIASGAVQPTYQYFGKS